MSRLIFINAEQWGVSKKCSLTLIEPWNIQEMMFSSLGGHVRDSLSFVSEVLWRMLLLPLDHSKGHGKDLPVVCPLPLNVFCAMDLHWQELPLHIYLVVWTISCEFQSSRKVSLIRSHIKSTLFMQIKMCLVRCPFLWKRPIKLALFFGQNEQSSLRSG